MEKIIKYIIITTIIGLIGYNAIYFQSLKERKNTVISVFDPNVLAKDFIQNKIIELPSMKAGEFLMSLKKDSLKFITENGKKLGISTDYYFIVESNAVIQAIQEENILITLDDKSAVEMLIATDFIFGNTVREASGIANIGDFQNTMDFNNISIALNDKIRSEIIPPFVEKAEKGNKIYFKGAIKVDTKKLGTTPFRIVPLILTFL
ncbi:MAG: DUF2291 family protein [Saprospiraceae bacterium]